MIAEMFRKQKSASAKAAAQNYLLLVARADSEKPADVRALEMALLQMDPPLSIADFDRDVSAFKERRQLEADLAPSGADADAAERAAIAGDTAKIVGEILASSDGQAYLGRLLSDLMLAAGRDAAHLEAVGTLARRLTEIDAKASGRMARFGQAQHAILRLKESNPRVFQQT